MGGEGLSVSFKRTENTTKTNKQLLKEFQKIIYSSRVVMHMKWYGEDRSVDILEHGDSNRQEWEQKYVPIEDTFQFEISVYDSWYEDADLYDSHDRKDSFVSLARKFANDNALMYFPRGYPAEWYEKNEQGQYQHYKVQSENKNIDKIYQIWHRYGIMALQAFDEELEYKIWTEAQEKIKPLIIA
jgi:hypothetical protein